MKTKNWSSFIFTLAILSLIILEILTLFVLGPIGFFQDKNDMAETSYFLTKYLPYFRIILLGIIIWTGIKIFKRPKRYPKIIAGIAMLIYLGIFYMSNFQLKADKLFSDQESVVFLPKSENEVPTEEVIIGVTNNGESKAYPLDFLAYHHKVLDSVGNKPVLVTYCIWSRTSRVFDPVVNEKVENFSLVGLGEYNAIMRDNSSSTWWQQATGEAIAGKYKGEKLDEIYFEQMTLEAWIQKYPNTKILQPDSNFIEGYEHNSKFVSRFCEEENGQDDDPWEERSWVIGISKDEASAAFDFIYLLEHNLIQDSVGDLPVLVVLEPDSITFHAWDARVNGQSLSFSYHQESNKLIESESGSVWDMSGTCISGSHEGEKLKEVQASEEYWYSWENFHPNTIKVGNVDYK